MGAVVRMVGMAIVFVAVLLAVYAGLRILDARRDAPRMVRAILAEMDPRVDAVPDTRLAKLVRVEDPTFWTNDGIDLRLPGAGMTTISQGLAKRLFFQRFRPGAAKIELVVLTKFALTPTVSKKDILRAAMATAYLGRDEKGAVIGFAEGARRWYGRELDELDERQFLGLVAMMPAPNRLDPARHAAANAERVARMERLIAGVCTPLGVRDVELKGCEI